MVFSKMGLESDPCFLDQRKKIPVLYGFAKISICVDNIVCLRIKFRVRIGTVFHVFAFVRVSNFIENIVHRSDREHSAFQSLIFEIAELAW